MKEALLYEKLEDKKVGCFLCAHRCHISNGKRGICAVRQNVDGVLFSLVYGKVVASHVDPIEKKPLFHFLPSSSSFSIATAGCNLRCQHCQNYEISQFPRERPDVPIPGEDMTPEEVVNIAERYGCKSIAYTYTEPTIFFEFAYDCAMLAKGKGIKNVFVSNGFMTPESVRAIAPYLDGNNIDLKGNEKFYKEVCGAKAKPVRDTIRLMKELGVWVEITTLIIPGYNDAEGDLKSIAEFIKSVDPAMPWHVTQFYPTYKLTDAPRTPIKTLRWARQMGFDTGLKYVYEGNVPGEGGENTYCPNCRELLILRFGFSIQESRIKDGKCLNCGVAIEGVWS
ncbi:MAG: AmmeMemoRadiSam system radical SAM enzyme [Nitrospirae bacterium GWF2_44_13]|nr:MAG: AmmeMemoRadiSam system radical SAM enzyme [Nitrospirae bacterium GWF2_44_13]OGW63967.1 MAG: AmmeMemoRadiSam system radical SAM enzyme [Nitrospirae bacterium RIFOXYA2_FULL_44_9]HBG92978.1 AmmeMemoRadiSam system radical SAM enzyme [Nitrospiraceae bacterium]